MTRSVPPATPAPSTGTLQLPFTTASVAVARRALASGLAEAHVSGQERDDALVVLSELVGNALRHARPLADGNVRVGWKVTTGEVEVAVADGGAATVPRADHPASQALSGRGLGIVDQLSSSWGVEGPGGPHQLVWAVVRRATLPRHGS